jgi:hypothetical protein
MPRLDGRSISLNEDPGAVQRKAPSRIETLLQNIPTAQHPNWGLLARPDGAGTAHCQYPIEAAPRYMCMAHADPLSWIRELGRENAWRYELFEAFARVYVSASKSAQAQARSALPGIEQEAAVVRVLRLRERRN